MPTPENINGPDDQEFGKAPDTQEALELIKELEKKILETAGLNQ